MVKRRLWTHLLGVIREEDVPLLAPKPEIARIALRPEEAATACGVSRDFFDEHIAPDLRWVRRGRLKLVSVAELENWLKRSAARTLEP